MLKWLIVIGLVWFVYNFYFKKKPISSQNSNKPLQENDMVKCSTCNVYVEIGEAIHSNGKYYCSQECLRGAK
jgi:uncharacterized protein